MGCTYAGARDEDVDLALCVLGVGDVVAHLGHSGANKAER